MTEKLILKEDRFIFIDIETGEVLDDANGYGYKTAQKAYKGYFFKKNRKSIEEKMQTTNNVIKEWLDEN